MSTPQNGGDILSVAIEIANQTHLRKICQSHSLAQIIQNVCLDLKLPFQEGQYALQLNLVGKTTTNMYLHEQNRWQIKNGDMLKLVYSPSEMAKILTNKILNKEQGGHGETSYIWGDEAVWALAKLQDLSSDVSFASEFCNQDGLRVVFDLITEPKQTPTGTHVMTCCLVTLDQMMGHEFVPSLPSPVLARIIALVNNPPGGGTGSEEASESLSAALSILGRIASTVEVDGYEFVSKALPIHQIVPHLWSDGEKAVQKNALALIVAIGRAALGNSRSARVGKDVVSKQVKDAISKSIIKDSIVAGEMAKELLNYQELVLSGKERKLNTVVDPDDPDLVSIMDASSFVNQGSRGSVGSLLDDHFMLSPGPRLEKATSMNDMPPTTPSSKAQAIIESDLGPPPSRPTSRLALDAMLYFRSAYPKPFMRMYLAEATASCQPFNETSQRLVEIIADVLSVHKKKKTKKKMKKKSRKGYINKYQPLVFKEPAFVEEVFCRMFLQLGRTRRDMRARTWPDQEKVMAVLQRQLAEALAVQPATLKDLTQQLRRLGYSEIAALWAQEAREAEDWRLAHSPAILELKQTRKEALLALIREQRINVLLKGTIFPKTSFGNQKAKRRNTFVVLSWNQKSFYYHDCDEDSRSIPGTSGTMAVADIAAVIVGHGGWSASVMQSQSQPHGKDTKTRKPGLVFSLLLEAGAFGEPADPGVVRLDLMAPDQETFDQWTDGINAMLAKEMTSKSLHAELDKLLDMEVRLLLLDVDNKHIPDKPPPIPAPPDNFNFSIA